MRFVQFLFFKHALVEASDKRHAITNKVTAQEAFKEEN
jgi:hypothetical protein